MQKTKLTTTCLKGFLESGEVTRSLELVRSSCALEFEGVDVEFELEERNLDKAAFPIFENTLFSSSSSSSAFSFKINKRKILF